MTNYMQITLELAIKGALLVSPNPLVGCVIEKDNKIIATGWHKGPGRPHAEIEALRQAGRQAARANVYINLEPCCHFGKTPPCVDALIAAKVNSVHVPFIDPNPLVNGKGLEKLKQAGIKIVVGEEAQKAKKINEIFLHYIAQKTPFVIAKWAMTLDGKIATRSLNSKWITEIDARRNYHQLRQRVDAILVGIGTVLADNPTLTPHLIPSVKNKKIPLRIVLDPLGQTPLTSNIIKFNPETTLIVVTTKSNALWQKQIIALGAKIWEFDSSINLTALMQQLGNMQICSLVVEGGARTLGAFFKENLVNKAYTYIAPKILADEKALSSLAGNEISHIKDSFSLRFDKAETIGNDLLVISYPKEEA